MSGAEKASLRVALILIVILLVAGFLRVWGMDYGIPHPTARPDEERIVGRAFTILATRDFHPGDFTYPGLLKYLDALALAIYVWMGELVGHYGKTWDFLFEAAVTNPGLQYRICRGVSVVFGVATVLVTFLLGRQTYGSRAIGLMGAAAVGTSFLHARDSRFATVDVAMTFFTTMSLLFAVKAAARYRTSDFVLAAVFAGLAAATKYNAGMVILGLVLPCVPGLLAVRPREGRPSGGAVVRRLALAAVVSGATFAFATPYSLLHYPAVLEELAQAQKVLYGGTGPSALWTHLAITFPEGLGWPFFLMAFAGVFRALWLRRPGDLVLLGFLIPFFVTVAGVRWVLPRYVIPLVPPLAVLAAELTFFVPCRSGKRKSLALLAAFVLAAPGLWKSIQFDRVASRKDTRLLASDWVAQNLPRRAPILICEGYGAPDINKDRRRPPAFEPRPIRCSVEELERGDARYLITHEHPWLHNYSRIADDVRVLLGSRARALAVFSPFNEPMRAEPYFYPGDAFYLPFSGLDAVSRGGPIITIWDLDPSS